jgi:hypothetical protein
MVDIAGNPTTTAVLEGNPAFGTYSGALESKGDHDWIRVNLVKDVVYKFFGAFLNAGSSTAGDATLALYSLDASGHPVLQAADDNSGAGENALMTFKAQGEIRRSHRLRPCRPLCYFGPTISRHAAQG